MMAKMKKMLGFKNTDKPETDFSLFFHEASSGEKKKLLTEVVRQANADQRALIDSYRQTPVSP